MNRTVNDIAEILNVPREAADGLLRFLRVVNLATFRGERPSATGRGKGASVYEIRPGASTVVAAAMEKIES